MQRIIIITVIVALLVGGGFLWNQYSQATQEPATEILRQAEVDRGSIVVTVNATGAVEPKTLLSLTFGVAGTVQSVHVTSGQIVEVGDVLAVLDSEERELTIRQAEDALRVQEVTLEQRLNSEPSPATVALARADIAAAEANLTIAQANLAAAEAAVLQAQTQKSQLLAGPAAGQIAAAEAQVAAARSQQKIAQDAHVQTLACFEVPLPEPTGETQEVCPALGTLEEQARANLESANAALNAAQAQLADVLAGAQGLDIQAADAAIATAEAGVLAAQGSVAAAEANVARAQAAYDRLLEPPSEEEITILEAQVTSGRTNLELARLRLEQSQIIAPISGTVASVLINAGEQAMPGVPVITLVDETALHVNVNVDEIDIDQVALGQEAEVTLDALSDETIKGTVTNIAPTPSNTGGVITYLVTIELDSEEDLVLRPGMSVDVAIVVDEIEDVLIVPNWAIRLDPTTGNTFVNLKQPDGAIEEVVVETGLRNEQFSEVLSGLTVGDVVVITNERDTFNLFDS